MFSVGFNSSHPMVMEGIGQVNIPVVLLSGDICGHVEFAFSINDLNAIGINMLLCCSQL